MSWLLPTPLLILAGAVGLALAWPRLRAPTSAARLLLEVAAVTLAVVAAFAGAWALLWVIEQRW